MCSYMMWSIHIDAGTVVCDSCHLRLFHIWCVHIWLLLCIWGLFPLWCVLSYSCSISAAILVPYMIACTVLHHLWYTYGTIFGNLSPSLSLYITTIPARTVSYVLPYLVPRVCIYIYIYIYIYTRLHYVTIPDNPYGNKFGIITLYGTIISISGDL